MHVSTVFLTPPKKTKLMSLMQNSVLISTKYFH